jgi:hypothetical protein
MKHVFAATCLAVTAAVALSAQAPYGQDQPKGKSTGAADEKTITVTGCLRAGDEPDTFVLANVKTDAAKGEKPMGTAGTSAIAPDSTLRLIGAPANQNLKAHVGHTVELTGTIAPRGKTDRTGSTPPAGTAGTTPPTTPPTEGGTPPDAAAGQRPRGASDMSSFNVKSMKHVSEKCAM